MPPKRFPKNQPLGKKPPGIRPQPSTTPSNQTLIEEATTSAASDDEAQQRFEEELAWCVHQLKISLTTKNLSGKQEEEVRKNLGTLENPQEALVKKRFVMNKAFGNYRQKMEQEKKKVPLELKNAKINVVTPASSSSFMRKSHLADPSVTSNFSFQKSDNAFRFNFKIGDEDK